MKLPRESMANRQIQTAPERLKKHLETLKRQGIETTPTIITVILEVTKDHPIDGAYKFRDTIVSASVIANQFSENKGRRYRSELRQLLEYKTGYRENIMLDMPELEGLDTKQRVLKYNEMLMEMLTELGDGVRYGIYFHESDFEADKLIGTNSTSTFGETAKRI